MQDFNDDIKAKKYYGDGSDLTINNMGILGKVIDQKLDKKGSCWSYTHKYTFKESIQIDSHIWQEVTHYTLQINTPELSALSISIHIPCCGVKNAKWARSRIQLCFDNEPISDATKISNVQTQYNTYLESTSLTGMVQNTSEGEHKISLKACINAGELFIPYYNPKLTEATIKESIFANLYMIGFY